MSSGQILAFQNFLRKAVTAISTISLYSSEHEQAKRLCFQALAHLMEAMGSALDISFMAIDGELIHGDRPIGNSMYATRFAQLLMNRGVGNIRITRNATLPEWTALLIQLSKRGDRLKPLSSSQNIKLGKVEVVRSEGGDQNQFAGQCPEGIDISSIPEREMARLMEIYEEVKNQKKMRVAGIHEIVNGLVSSLQQEATSFLVLAPLRSLDEYTFSHSINVCILNLSQAMGLGIEGPILHDIGIAAMLHDIGKLFLPMDLINKHGGLNQAEWALVKQHPVQGARYLLDFPEIPRLAVVTAFEHHMKFNGEGYPKVSQEWKQNLCSQMTTISDFFDALRTSRSYKDSLQLDEIVTIMQDRIGIEIHPTLTRNFFQILKPLHSICSYSAGETDLTKGHIIMT